MKSAKYYLAVLALALFFVNGAFAQPGTENLIAVNVQMLKTKWPEGGSMKARDSLLAIYNEKVTKQNNFILSHKEYSHWFTSNNRDYMVIEEYKSFDDMTKSFEMNLELEKKAWPDEKKRKDFMNALGAYFEDWHGDALYRSNPQLAK